MKTLLFISTVLLFQLNLLAQQDSVLAEQYYEQADTTEDLTIKLELLQKSLDAGFSPLFVYERMGYVYEQTDKFDLALAYYEKSLKLAETDYQESIMNALLAGIYIKKEDYTSAKEYCEDALDTDSPYSLAYFNMGLILQEDYNYSLAIEYFKKYIYYNPSKAYYQLVVCYEESYDYENLLYYAELLLEEDPDFDFAKQAKLKALIYANKKEEVIIFLKKCYPASPEKGVYDLFAPYVQYAEIAFNAEGYDLAKKYYKCVLGEFIQNREIFYESWDVDSFTYVMEIKMAQCSYLQGKYEEANTTFEKYKKTQGSDRYLWYVWASSYMEKGDYKTAIKLFKKSLKLSPYNTETIQTFAQCYARSGDHKKAIEMYTKGIDLDDEEASLFNGRACAYLQLKELDKAYNDIQQAIELDPISVELTVTLGEYYFAKEDFDKAIETMNEALSDLFQTDQTDKYAYYTRGKAYASRHNGSLAITDFEAALEIDPNFAPVLQELGIAIKRKGDYCAAKPYLERAVIKKDKFKDYDFSRAEKTLEEIKDKNCRD